MTRMPRTLAILLALLTTASFSPETWAQNNKKPGGGGGGGSTNLSYRTIALSQQYGYVSSINSQGEMVGMIQGADGTYLPYRWEVNTGDNVAATQLDLTLSGGFGVGGVLKGRPHESTFRGRNAHRSNSNRRTFVRHTAPVGDGGIRDGRIPRRV